MNALVSQTAEFNDSLYLLLISKWPYKTATFSVRLYSLRSFSANTGREQSPLISLWFEYYIFGPYRYQRRQNPPSTCWETKNTRLGWAAARLTDFLHKQGKRWVPFDQFQWDLLHNAHHQQFELFDALNDF